MFVVSPTTSIFAIRNRQELLLAYSVALFVARVVAITIGSRMLQSEAGSLALYSGVGAFANLVLGIWVLRWSGRRRPGAVGDANP